MGDHRSLVKKGKDCIAVAGNLLNDINSGSKEIPLKKKLVSLQRDGSFLAGAAEQLAKWLEAVEKYIDAHALREIEDLNRKEIELKHQKIEEESQLAAHQNVLQDNQNRLSSEEDRLRDAERKLRKAQEEEKRIQIGSTVGGAVLGLFTGGVGLLVGAAAGAGIGAIINDCRREERDARGAVNRHRNDLHSAHSAVTASQGRIANIESQISSLTNQIEYMKQQRFQSQKRVDEIRSLINFVKKSVCFWSLFMEISKDGVNHTVLLQKIVTSAAEKKDYPAILSKSSQRIAGTFIEAWKDLETMEVEYKCSRCHIQYIALPFDISAFICKECHS